MNHKKILGLDVGTNSIGWALITENEHQRMIDILDFNSHIFSAPINPKNKTPLNVARRTARIARRRLERRSRRVSKLRHLLIREGWLQQDDPPEPHIYQLRAKALAEPLTKKELAFIFLSFAKRRGFLSARKTELGNLRDYPPVQDLIPKPKEDLKEAEKSSDDKEEQGMLKEIANLQDCIDAHDSQQLGGYLASLPQNQRKRGLHTNRAMYQNEFNAIWEKQQTYHPQDLTEQLNSQIHDMLFYQRPINLKGGKHRKKKTHSLRGFCSLEPNRQRAHKAWPQCQEFRIWQSLANLNYHDPLSGEDIPLTLEQKQTLADQLMKKEKMTLAAMRKAVALKNVKFNLETSGLKELRGHSTNYRIAKVIKDWFLWPQEKQIQLVEDLITIDDKVGLFERLREYWELERETAFNLCRMQLEKGYMNLSLRAIKRLLPNLKEDHNYSEARKQAGYDYALQPQRGQLSQLPAPPKIPNPVVNRALHRMRLIVNAVIDTFGPIDEVRIEMAREVKVSNKRLTRILKQQKDNQKCNEEAEKCYKDIRLNNQHLNLAENMSHFNRLKYRLWIEQDQCCMYTPERKIGLTELFSPAVEVDHILPISRTMDDSYMNKVLCRKSENQNKRHQTVWEWLEHDEARLNHIRGLVKHKGYPVAKRKRLFTKSLDKLDTFISRQLNDTAYIARETATFLKTIGVDVSFTKGQYTNWLAHQWGFHTLLPRRPKDDSKDKNRMDHRHHALDALVVACTGRKLFKDIHQQAEAAEALYQDVGRHRIKIAPPLDNMRQRVEAHLAKVTVTYMPQNRTTAALHDETILGLWRKPEGGFSVVKKVLLDSTFTAAQAKKVVDEALRERLVRFFENGGKITSDQPYIFHKTPMRHVKIEVSKTFNRNTFLILGPEPSDTQLPERMYEIKGCHHVEIYRNFAKPKLILPVFRSYLEVGLRKDKGISHHAFRNNLKEALAHPKGASLDPIETDIGPEWAFLMALHKKDMVKIWVNDAWKHYNVVSFEPSEKKMLVSENQSAAIDRIDPEVIKTTVNQLISTFRMTPLSVNILGHPCNTPLGSEVADD